MAAETPEMQELEKLLTYFRLSPTGHQYQAFHALIRLLATDKPRATLVLRGAAGTGKTTMMRALVQYLQAQEVQHFLLAPTGRAAKVLARKTLTSASTLHKFIYHTSTLPDGGSVFTRRHNEDAQDAVYIVDEASMISDEADSYANTSLLNDLISYVFVDGPHRKLLLVGDPAQLPPVGKPYSIALIPSLLKQQYGLLAGQVEMTEVKRQALASGVLLNATRLREQISLKPTLAPVTLPQLAYHPEVHLLENAEELLQVYTDAFDPDLLDQIVVLTYSNQMAAQINRAIRARIHFDPEALLEKDVVMVVKNFYQQGLLNAPFIANGELGRIRKVFTDSTEDRCGQTWCDALVSFTELSRQPLEMECKIPISLLNSKYPALTREESQQIYTGRIEELRNEGLPANKKVLKKDPYINSLQLKYGYAITTHKAQGGQWEQVIVVFEPYLTHKLVQEDYLSFLRWTYTAFTRAVKKLYLLDCPFEFLKEEIVAVEQASTKS